jgi:putative SbcD/Mre11-related phosphoesterase
MIEFGEWLLTPQRAAVHVPTATLVAADLHLGYHQARRRKGEAIPLWSVEELLAPLASIAAGVEVRQIVVAGDFLEGGWDGEIVDEFLAWCSAAKVELLGIVPGNHDAGWIRRNEKLPVLADGIRLGKWLVLHGHRRLPKVRVVHGHVHPCFRIGKIAAPCFLLSESRLVLPAFTEDAAGENVLAGRRWSNYRCVVCAGQKVLDFGIVKRLQSRPSRT